MAFQRYLKRISSEILQSSFTKIIAFSPESMNEEERTVNIIVRVNVSDHESDDDDHHHERMLETPDNNTFASTATPSASSFPTVSPSPSASSRPLSLQRLRTKYLMHIPISRN